MGYFVLNGQFGQITLSLQSTVQPFCIAISVNRSAHSIIGSSGGSSSNVSNTAVHLPHCPEMDKLIYAISRIDSDVFFMDALFSFQRQINYVLNLLDCLSLVGRAPSGCAPFAKKLVRVAFMRTLQNSMPYPKQIRINRTLRQTLPLCYGSCMF